MKQYTKYCILLKYYRFFIIYIFSASAEILAGFCLIALLICIVMRLYVKDKADEDEEKVALINEDGKDELFQ